MDEHFIERFDDEVQKEIQQLLVQFKQFKDLEKQRKAMLVRIESALL